MRVDSHKNCLVIAPLGPTRNRSSVISSASPLNSKNGAHACKQNQRISSNGWRRCVPPRKRSMLLNNKKRQQACYSVCSLVVLLLLFFFLSRAPVCVLACVHAWQKPLLASKKCRHNVRTPVT
jgi:hypothetical protein